jgi:hypothetical protein
MTILEQNACNAIISMAKKDEPDYWTRLEHQYAGMAMQGFLAGGVEATYDRIAEFSIEQAHALIEKLKGKEERK